MNLGWWWHVNVGSSILTNALIWWGVDNGGGYACVGERRYKIFHNHAHHGLNTQTTILLGPVKKHKVLKDPHLPGAYHQLLSLKTQSGLSNSERCMFSENRKFTEIEKGKKSQGENVGNLTYQLSCATLYTGFRPPPARRPPRHSFRSKLVVAPPLVPQSYANLHHFTYLIVLQSYSWVYSPGGGQYPVLRNVCWINECPSHPLRAYPQLLDANVNLIYKNISIVNACSCYGDLFFPESPGFFEILR